MIEEKEEEPYKTLAELALEYQLKPRIAGLQDSDDPAHDELPALLEEVAQKMPIQAIKIALYLAHDIKNYCISKDVIAPYVNEIPDDDHYLLRRATACICGQAFALLSSSIWESDIVLFQALGILFKKLERSGLKDEVLEIADRVISLYPEEWEDRVPLEAILPFASQGKATGRPTRDPDPA